MKSTLASEFGWMHKVDHFHHAKMMARHNRLPRGAWRDAVFGHPMNNSAELFPWEIAGTGRRTFTPFVFRFIRAAVHAGFTSKAVCRLLGCAHHSYAKAIRDWEEWIEQCEVARLDPTGYGMDTDKLIEALIVAAAPEIKDVKMKKK